MGIRHARRASPETVAAFESKHKIALPLSYRAFLIEKGGGAPEPNAVTIGADVIYVALFFSLDDERMKEQLFGFPPPRIAGY